MLAGLFLAAATLPSVGVCAEDAVIADPKHYTLEFIRVNYGPHEKSVMHTHGPNVAVFLSNGKVRFALPDGSAIEATQEVGGVEWADAEEHLPENLSDQPLQVLLVELKD